MSGVARVPFTLAFLIVMALSNWLAGTFDGMLPPQSLRDWGISHHTLLSGEAFRLVTGTFLSHDLAMFLRQFGFVAIVIGAYEWTQGTGRAIAMFFFIDILGTLLVLLAVLPMLIGLPYQLGEVSLSAHDVGMSAGGFGLIGALMARQAYGLVFLVGGVAALAIKAWISFDPIADSAHLICLLIGFALQRAIWPVGPSDIGSNLKNLQSP